MCNYTTGMGHQAASCGFEKRPLYMLSVCGVALVRRISVVSVYDPPKSQTFFCLRDRSSLKLGIAGLLRCKAALRYR